MSTTREAMESLASRPDVLFVGQGVGCPGTRMSPDFAGVADDRKIEFPVAEELQLGYCLGLSLEGFVPVSVFPRANFLLRAADQLVNHLDALPLFSDYRPRVIVRTAVGSPVPLDAGPQHTGEGPVDGFLEMLRTVSFMRLPDWDDPVAVYESAYSSGGSHLVVEYP